ncbi:peptidase inhibitor family I36 protein [Nostoc linckia]|uniref:peptidase inhibitor family I36 protein n=1 Tax=Nostoc linckia TaxID=92942 RepID=UPI000C0006F1|nr:peptidase inhibitor family I36 protein [Nostoc linckia]
MKTTLLSGLTVTITAAIVTIPSGIRPNVANAQFQLPILANCPQNSVCAWSERNFVGNRLVVSPLRTETNEVGNKICIFPGNALSPGGSLFFTTKLKRSIRNNTPCDIKLYIEDNIGDESAITTISPNTQQDDSGEFRSIGGGFRSR